MTDSQLVQDGEAIINAYARWKRLGGSREEFVQAIFLTIEVYEGRMTREEAKAVPYPDEMQ